MDKVLEVKCLCKAYPSFRLKDVSFSVDEGMIMGFIGRNGAGKTTTMKSVLRLVHPDSGNVFFFGEEFDKQEGQIRERIGYASGGNTFYQRKRIKELTNMTKSFYPNWDDMEYRRYLELFGLDENKKLMELSEGMKVKFSLTLALSHHAELLILDEPTSGLDPVSRDELLDIFSYLKKQGVAILFSTHITTDLEKCADSITYIRKGEIVESKPLPEFMADYPGTKELEEIMVRLERNPLQFDGQ